MKKKIVSQKAPTVGGTYSHAVESNHFVYTSCLIGMTREPRQVVEGIEAQTRLAIENIAAILEEDGLTLADVVKTNVYLIDMNDFAVVNQIYAEYFAGEVLPARSCVQIGALPRPEARISIEVIAYKP